MVLKNKAGMQTGQSSAVVGLCLYVFDPPYASTDTHLYCTAPDWSDSRAASVDHYKSLVPVLHSPLPTRLLLWLLALTFSPYIPWMLGYQFVICGLSHSLLATWQWRYMSTTWAYTEMYSSSWFVFYSCFCRFLRGSKAVVERLWR